MVGVMQQSAGGKMSREVEDPGKDDGADLQQA